ncbi:MAG: AAA family ATPase [Lachnospiraceae bacterium]|jgi:putative ATP-dependent endonuclease of OLD family|nr:AAA family ATPase [Lachnospiraceae bacterium]MCI8995438.1 AAA family ATPase [Lachnospiraceae bacterium]
MQLVRIHIKNFKSVRDLCISDIENALILVGKNNTGKSSVLDAICLAGGVYQVKPEDFNERQQNIEIQVSLKITPEDLKILHAHGIVSVYKRYEAWERDFCSKLPSFQNGILEFEYVVNWEGRVRYGDGKKKHNRWIPELLPRIYYLDAQRNLSQIQEDLLLFQEDEQLKRMRSDCCMFDQSKKCSRCFSCIGLIHQKKPEELSAFETAKLLEYKFYQLNLNAFQQKVNENFHRNGGALEEIRYTVSCDSNQMFRVKAKACQRERGDVRSVERLGKGMRSMYMLSLLEACMDSENRLPCLILMEDPEIFLHPKLQKVSSEVLYRLSKKNQVVFSTHSPNLLFNFNSRQIRQVVLDEECYSVIREKADIGRILDDLGYSANDLMDVSFVFLVEGKQDKSRLPLLLSRYYSEIYDEEGKLSRIAIITTNSCTNIKTYANLKYMNQVYIKDQFLMIRDGDGQDSEKLARKLCQYYEQRGEEDPDRLPRVTRDHVLILKYYSFENYFLNPEIMAKVGVLEQAEDFYRIFLEKWREYLHRIRSGQALAAVLGHDIRTEEDVKEHMEEIRIHMRGHNLYDIFYGPYKGQENELLSRYIELAPREEFGDILDAIDRFVYFDSRRISEH